jgi:hypothetical protein
MFASIQRAETTESTLHAQNGTGEHSVMRGHLVFKCLFQDKTLIELALRDEAWIGTDKRASRLLPKRRHVEWAK